MKIIAAVNALGYIGKDGKLPWHVPEDLEFFKHTTKKSVLIMGRKTFKSLNYKSLPNRITIVVSTTLNPKEYPSAIIVPDLNQALERAKDFKRMPVIPLARKVFVVGGRELYKEALQFADEVIISTIPEFTIGDTLFPFYTLRELFRICSYERLYAQIGEIDIRRYKTK